MGLKSYTKFRPWRTLYHPRFPDFHFLPRRPLLRQLRRGCRRIYLFTHLISSFSLAIIFSVTFNSNVGSA